MTDWLDEQSPVSTEEELQEEEQDMAEQTAAEETEEVSEEAAVETEEAAAEEPEDEPEEAAEDEAGEEPAEEAVDPDADYASAAEKAAVEATFGEDEEEKFENPEDERPNDSVFVMGLLDMLADELSQHVNDNFMTKSRLDIKKCQAMLQRARQNIPAGIRYSNHYAQETERVLHNAEDIAARKAQAAQKKYNAIKEAATQEAETIVAEAKKKAETIVAAANQRAEAILSRAKENAEAMVSESQITKDAQQKALEIKKRSIAESNKRHVQALDDSWLLLNALQKQVDAISAKLQTKKEELYPEQVPPSGRR